MGIAVGEGAQADLAQPIGRLLARFRRARSVDLQRDGDVLRRGLPRHQRIGLEEVAGLPVDARQTAAVDFARAGGGLQETGRDVEERGLAAAGRADDRHELAVADVEVGFGDCRVGRAGMSAIGDVDAAQPDRGIAPRPCRLRMCGWLRRADGFRRRGTAHLLPPLSDGPVRLFCSDTNDLSGVRPIDKNCLRFRPAKLASRRPCPIRR